MMQVYKKFKRDETCIYKVECRVVRFENNNRQEYMKIKGSNA